jgi:hypothetical protein
LFLLPQQLATSPVLLWLLLLLLFYAKFRYVCMSLLCTHWLYARFMGFVCYGSWDLSINPLPALT